MSQAAAQQARRAELAEALRLVNERIRAACAAAGRDPDEVELLAVTKTHPAEDVALLLDLGLDLFAENRVQEAETKLRQVAELRQGSRARWRVVGRLQRNKARSVARWADRVESVDSLRLAQALDQAATRALDLGERVDPLPVLVQVSLDGDPARGGVPVAELDGLTAQLSTMSGLALHGLMAVAPLGADPDRAFGTLEQLSERLRTRLPHARVISAGMTADLERAIRHGSTCVRVGTALLGDRRLASP